MNRAAACIKLIQILSVRNEYVSTEELADILETNPRNIREYIKELEVAGYTLESMKGVYGGYRLDKSCLLPAVKLTNEDKKVLASGVEYLLQKKEFLNYSEFEAILGRILASVERTDVVTEKFSPFAAAGETSDVYANPVYVEEKKDTIQEEEVVSINVTPVSTVKMLIESLIKPVTSVPKNAKGIDDTVDSCKLLLCAKRSTISCISLY